MQQSELRSPPTPPGVDTTRSRTGCAGSTWLVVDPWRRYTWLFGLIAAFLFLRTGHFIAPFLTHAFCNCMGLPGISWRQSTSPLHCFRSRIGGAYLVGIVLFFAAMYPFTTPSLYGAATWDFAL